MKNLNFPKVSSRRGQYLQAIAFVAGLMLTGAAQAATFTWDGGGANALWSNPLNWAPDGTPNNDGTDDIHMAGVVRTTNRPNAGWDINSLTFDASAGAFTLNKAFASDAIALEGGGIVNNSVNSQIINNDISMQASQTFNAAAGNLTFGGIIDLFSTTLTVDGANSSTFGGVIQGLGTVVKNGAGTLTLSGPSTFSGGSTVSAGVLALGNNSGAGTGPITLSGGELQASGGSRTIGNSVTFSGGAIGGSQNLTLSGVASGAALVKNGTGTLALGSANPGLTGSVVANGPISLDAANALQNVTSVTLNTGGGLTLNATGNHVNDSASLTLAGGTLNGNNKTETFGALNLTASSTINLTADSTSGSLTFASGSRTAGNLTINGWSGTSSPSSVPTAGTDDHIFLSADPGSAFLAAVNFTGFGTGATRLASGELVPVPEPRTIVSAIALFGFGIWRFFSSRSTKKARLA